MVPNFDPDHFASRNLNNLVNGSHLQGQQSNSANAARSIEARSHINPFIIAPLGGEEGQVIGDIEDEDFDHFDEDLDMEEKKDGPNFEENGPTSIAHFGVYHQSISQKHNG